MSVYTLGKEPLIVGRTPTLALSAVFQVFRAPDSREALRALLSGNETVRAAIAVASPSLHGAMLDWIEHRPLKNSAAPLRLLAYVARMSTRPTPFGFFASISDVRVGDATTLAIGDGGARRAHARADMGWLLPLAREVEDDPTARLALRITRNPCIIERAGRLHVMNPMNVRREEENQRIEHTPISLKHTPAVACALAAAQHPCTLSDVVQTLVRQFEAPREQAEKLVDQLWQAGLFISELRPNPCGDPARALGARLTQAHPRGEQIAHALHSVDDLSGTPIHEIAADRYLATIEALRSVHEVPSALQLDATHRFSGTLGEPVMRDVLRLADVYVRCSQRMSLEKYREAFMRRYEGTDRLVPLLELVNPDFGLGSPAEPEMVDEKPHDARNSDLVDLATRALMARERVVTLDDETFERICPRRDGVEPPERFEIGFQVAASSHEAVERGEYLIVPSNLMAAIGAGRTVGRFASALGADVTARLERFARESCGERIVAEMSYLPPTLRSLNVAQRPNPYAYEVPIGVISGGATPILPSDILVGVRGDRFFLYSKQLRREITVRESHVFNTTAGAPDICRFLSFVERDSARTFVGFDWGAAHALAVLPRLVHGRVVLAPLTWRASKSMFEGPLTGVVESVAAWRAQWNLPEIGYLRDNDQWLPVDFTSTFSLEMLRDQLKRTTGATVQFCEVLPGEDSVWVTGTDASERFATEFIASVAANVHRLPEVAGVVEVNNPARRRGPDSEWLYAKLYCGAGLLDALIAQHVAPLVAELYAGESIDRAFFLRYGDPDSHLRVRMRRSPAMSRAALFEQLAAAYGVLLASGKIERFTFDTYERELERYGGAEMIDDVELLFSEDSRRCFAAITGGTRTQHRKMTDALVSMRWLLDGMLDASEYRAYLEHRGRPRKLSSDDWSVAKAVRAEYLGGMQPRSDVFERIRERAGNRAEIRFAMLDSLLHMHCNRLGLDRSLEIRTMDVLWNVCNGVLARQDVTMTVG